jgi:hypothetical protein
MKTLLRELGNRFGGFFGTTAAVAYATGNNSIYQKFYGSKMFCIFILGHYVVLVFRNM